MIRAWQKREMDRNYVYVFSLGIVYYGIILVNEVFVRAFNMGAESFQWLLPLDGPMTLVGASFELLSGVALIVAGGLIRARKALGVWVFGLATFSYSIGLFLDEIAFGQARENVKVRSFEFEHITEVDFVAIILLVFVMNVFVGLMRIRSGALK